jgi:hypothetical protein
MNSCATRDFVVDDVIVLNFFDVKFRIVIYPIMRGALSSMRSMTARSCEAFGKPSNQPDRPVRRAQQ